MTRGVPATAETPTPVQGQGLVQALRQTAGGRLVPVVQLAVERSRAGRASGYVGTVVGSLEAPAPVTGCSRLAT